MGGLGDLHVGKFLGRFEGFKAGHFFGCFGGLRVGPIVGDFDDLRLGLTVSDVVGMHVGIHVGGPVVEGDIDDTAVLGLADGAVVRIIVNWNLFDTKNILKLANPIYLKFAYHCTVLDRHYNPG